MLNGLQDQVKMKVKLSLGDCSGRVRIYIYIYIYIYYIYSIWVFLHKHSRLTGQQGKGEGISFPPASQKLDISRVITAESSPLHITSGRNKTGNLWFPITSR